MPAVLSAKLFVEAAKVGGSAFTGGLTHTLQSAMSSVVESPEKRRRSQRNNSE